ncbi:MAG: hypothetical protein ACO24B_01435 [Ilumatobacteraceae bacterium]
MRFLLTFALICALFGVSYSQEDRDLRLVGKADGHLWFIDFDTVTEHIDGTRSGAMVRTEDGGLIAAFQVADCQRSRLKILKMAFFKNGKMEVEIKGKNEWLAADGFGRKVLAIMCQPLKTKTSKGLIGE